MGAVASPLMIFCQFESGGGVVGAPGAGGLTNNVLTAGLGDISACVAGRWLPSGMVTIGWRVGTLSFSGAASGWTITSSFFSKIFGPKTEFPTCGLTSGKGAADAGTSEGEGFGKGLIGFSMTSVIQLSFYIS